MGILSKLRLTHLKKLMLDLIKIIMYSTQLEYIRVFIWMVTPILEGQRMIW